MLFLKLLPNLPPIALVILDHALPPHARRRDSATDVVLEQARNCEVRYARGVHVHVACTRGFDRS